MKCLIDTNILLRSAEVSSDMHADAVDSVAAIRKNKYIPCLVPQNYYEFWSASTRPVTNNGRGMSPAEVEAEFRQFRRQFRLLPDTSDVFPQRQLLVSTNQVLGKKTHDARLIASMKVHSVSHILTFNAPDTRYPGITVLTPQAVLGLVP